MKCAVLMGEVREVTIGMETGLLLEFSGRQDVAIAEEKRVGAGESLILGEVVDAERNAVGALVEHRMGIEDPWIEKVLDDLSISHG